MKLKEETVATTTTSIAGTDGQVMKKNKRKKFKDLIKEKCKKGTNPNR